MNRPLLKSCGIWLAILSLAVVGCGSDGPKLANVSGTVTSGGKPQANLTVDFSPADGSRGAQGLTGADGRYKLNFTPEKGGTPVGPNHVTIYSGGMEGGPPQKVLLSVNRDVPSGSVEMNFELTEVK